MATLSEFKERLVFRRIDRSRDNATHAGNRARQTLKALGSGASPDKEAITFYAMNHVMADISRNYHPEETLPEDVADLVSQYADMAGIMAARLFYYLCMICTREARHAGYKDELRKELKKLFGPLVADFLTSLPPGSSEAATAFRTSVPSVELGVYTRALFHVFAAGSFSGGYGGSKWADVAKVLDDFVFGRISAEMMLDTGFTLAHNNGPIFNKGMLYKGYTSKFMLILDVQRAGMVPSLIRENIIFDKDWTDGLISFDMKIFMEKALMVLQENLYLPFVDWFAVEKLGALHSYHHQKQYQTKAYGENPAHKDLISKLIEEKKAEAMAKIEAEKHKLVLAPGLVVKKVERSHA